MTSSILLLTRTHLLRLTVQVDVAIMPCSSLVQVSKLTLCMGFHMTLDRHTQADFSLIPSAMLCVGILCYYVHVRRYGQPVCHDICVCSLTGITTMNDSWYVWHYQQCSRSGLNWSAVGLTWSTWLLLDNSALKPNPTENSLNHVR